MTKLESAAHAVIHKCINVQKGESILILANSPHEEIAAALYNASCKKTKNSYYVQVANIDGKTAIPPAVAYFLARMDAAVLVTTPSISHTEERRRASKRGTRIVSMPNITVDTFCRLANADYTKIERKSRKLSDILTIAKEAVVTSDNGTNLRIPLRRKKGYADTGILHGPGSFSNLPAGEASIAPDEGETEGVLVVDSGMGCRPEEGDSLVLTIREGKAYRISGGTAAARLRRQLAQYGPSSRMVAEFGIGTNDSAKLSGHSLEDEKVLGTIHLAIGNNVSFGGNNNVPIHLDGVVYNATVEIDGKRILEKGKYLL